MSDILFEKWETEQIPVECSHDRHGNPINPPITIMGTRWKRLVSYFPDGPWMEVPHNYPL